MGEQVLTLAVLSILITAPLGAIGILGLGPKLLSCDLPAAGQEQDLEQNQDQTIDPNSEEIIDLQREQDKFLESEFRIEEKVKDNDITGEKKVNQHDLQVEMGIIFLNEQNFSRKMVSFRKKTKDGRTTDKNNRFKKKTKKRQK